MQAAAILLGLAALGGLTIAILRFRGAPYPPLWMALVHGLIAATGLGALIYTAVSPGIPQLGIAALVIFVLAALGGAVMFLGFHMRGKPLPILFVVGHGSIAVIGYVLLLLSWLRPA